MTNLENNQNLIDKLLTKLLTPKIYLKDNILHLESGTLVSLEELARAINKSSSFITQYFWSRGKKIAKNENISFDLLEEFLKSLKIKIQLEEINFNNIINEFVHNEKQKIKIDELSKRPPVIAIMGHIDHGKTTLLDTLCKTSRQKKEAGGITQKITVIPVEFQNNKLLFLDTPGHNDFIRLRHRGATLTDLIVLIIDGQEGIKSQTLEIIEYAKKFLLPIVVFINYKKIGINNNLEIQTQLQKKGVVALEWGGETIILSGSAKNINDINFLLENVLLVMKNCCAYKTILTTGVIIDSYLQQKTNSVINKLLVQTGSLKKDDFFFVMEK